MVKKVTNDKSETCQFEVKFNPEFNGDLHFDLRGHERPLEGHKRSSTVQFDTYDINVANVSLLTDFQKQYYIRFEA